MDREYVAKKDSRHHSFWIKEESHSIPFSSQTVPESCVHSGPGCTCGGFCSACQTNIPLQAQYAIGAPNDRYEQEADRVADHVMAGRKIEQGLATTSIVAQRQPLVADEDEDEVEEASAEKLIMAKSNAVPVDRGITDIASELGGLDSKGMQIPVAVRSEFEELMGNDFSHVRIHTDGHAGLLAQRLNARAFTLEKHIVFSPNQYQPTTHQGRHLLAHELTHIVQQARPDARRANSPVQRVPASSRIIQREPGQRECRLVALSKQELDVVKSDFILASRDVSSAISKLRAGASNLLKIKRALRCYFNVDTYTDAFREKVLVNLEKINKAVVRYSGGHFLSKVLPGECCMTEAGAAIAMTGKAQFDSEGRFVSTPTMKLCDIYFNNLTPTQRRRTLIHECAHVMGLAPEKAKDEIRVGDEGFMLINSSRLLKTADSHAHLVMALAANNWPDCPAVDVSAGVESGATGSVSSAKQAGWYASAYVDVMSKTPVLRFFYPYGRFAFTVMATPARQPRTNVSGIQADMTYMAELLAGSRIKLHKGRTGMNWYVSFGGGPVFAITGIPDGDGKKWRFSAGLKTTSVAGLRFNNLEVKTNLSYLYLPGVPGFKHSLQGGLTVGYRFTLP